jgi:hypothetical protein
MAGCVSEYPTLIRCYFHPSFWFQFTSPSAVFQYALLLHFTGFLSYLSISGGRFTRQSFPLKHSDLHAIDQYFILGGSLRLKSRHDRLHMWCCIPSFSNATTKVREEANSPLGL